MEESSTSLSLLWASVKPRLFLLLALWLQKLFNVPKCSLSHLWSGVMILPTSRGDGQGGLACCDSWGCKELDTTEWLNWLNWLFLQWTNIYWFILPFYNWRKIALQGCAGFCRTAMQISHNYACITSPDSLHPAPLGHRRALNSVPRVLEWLLTSCLFHAW